MKKDDEGTVTSVDHPVEEFTSMQKIMKVHDKLIYENILVVENAGKNIDSLITNMEASNKIVKGIISSIGDINKILRTIIKRLPKK